MANLWARAVSIIPNGEKLKWESEDQKRKFGKLKAEIWSGVGRAGGPVGEKLKLRNLRAEIGGKSERVSPIQGSADILKKEWRSVEFMGTIQKLLAKA